MEPASCPAPPTVSPVKQLHHRNQLAALDLEIDTAPFHPRIERALAEHGGIQQSADCQQAVADRLSLQSARGTPPVQPVPGIDRSLGLREPGTLRVGLAHDDLLVQRLEPPAVLDQLTGQPVEKFGVRRQFALQVEVAWGTDDAAPEVVLPKPIDHHARQQLPRPVFGVDQPVGQRPAAETGPPTPAWSVANAPHFCCH